MESSVPFLPPEVHRIIAQHVHRFDLPNYRLASKVLAEIGAEELFSSITFHSSTASTARVEAMKARQRVRKHVKTMFWDTNLWKLADVRDFHEWKMYFESKKAWFLDEPGKYSPEHVNVTRLGELENNWQEWEAYLENLEDEKLSRSQNCLGETFIGFNKLRKVHVINGSLTLGHRGIKKESIFTIPLATDPPGLKRGEHLYIGEAYISKLPRPGYLAFQTLLKASSLCLRKLRIDALCYLAFRESITSIGTLDTLTSLHLRLTTRFDYHEGLGYESGFAIEYARIALHEGHLTDFLMKLPNLESLHLDLGTHCEVPEVGYIAPSTVEDIFREDYTWPNLRKLSLCNFNTTPRAILSLLERHNSTLKDLRLHFIVLEVGLDGTLPDNDWPSLLQAMSETLHLARATLSSWLRCHDSEEEDEWYLDADGEIAHAVARYLVHGGECPLQRSNITHGRTD